MYIILSYQQYFVLNGKVDITCKLHGPFTYDGGHMIRLKGNNKYELKNKYDDECLLKFWWKNSK